ncbi:MAG: hypothetical protein JSV93_05695 [Candidatus Omnitrophota bacterium]|nr:MAG: hypothetical protein JSV93_05695 [Candidatus Omnitrophota bacterium]
MKPSRHIIASLTLGGLLWLFTKSVYVGSLCFASGILVDVDHVLEYIIHHGWKGLTFKNVYRACEQTAKQEGKMRFKKIYIIFHTGEAVLLLWAITVYTKNIYLLAITIGFSLHLILDCIGNSLRPFSYSVCWRAINKFDSNKLFIENRE